MPSSDHAQQASPASERQAADNTGIQEARRSAESDSRSPALIVVSTSLSVADYVERSRAPATRRAHKSDWSGFLRWCTAEGRQPLPASPETVAEYLAAHGASHKPATLRRWLATISVAHDAAGLPTPTKDVLVRSVLAGIRRTRGVAPNKKDPLIVSDLRRVLTALPTTTTGLRDRAVIGIGFAGSMRRSEVSGLDVTDVAFEAGGMTLTIRRSKTDQEALGREIGVPFGHDPDTCPVRALVTWLTAAEITSGPIFRGVGRYGTVSRRRLCDRSVADIVKGAVTRVGLDSRRFAGHSLRSGFATSAARAGLEPAEIALQTGHRDLRVLDGYIHHARVLDHSPALAVRL